MLTPVVNLDLHGDPQEEFDSISSIAARLLSGAHCDHHNLRSTLCDINNQTYAAEKERTYAF